jgi:large subunit ribosomal protein L21e
LQSFDNGEKVIIFPEPSSQKGMPFLRYKGNIGKVVERRGQGYLVEIDDGGKKKIIISRPEHLKRA